MKYMVYGLLALLLVPAVATAAAKPKPNPVMVTWSGTIIDNHCAQGHKTDLAVFIQTHTKDCALMKNCEASGYSLYTADGKLVSFTKKGNWSVAIFLKDKASTLRVEVKGYQIGDKIEAVYIKNKS